MQSYRCIVSGLVQGVYYRKNVSERAFKENFKGYVKNLPNGEVEACVQCTQDRFQKFLEILEDGSPNSRVDNIEVSKNDATYTSFEIRY